MKKRIKLLRSELNLTQTQFANKIGLARNTIACYETGSRTPNDAIIKSICREFNINPFWLKEGKGEIFNTKKESSLDLLSKDYDLDEVDKIVIQRYLQLSEDDRKSINNFILGISNK